MDDRKRSEPKFATPSNESARFLVAQLEHVHARIRGSRTRPLDRAAIGELTALRFSATRLTRRLRLLGESGRGAERVRLFDPTRELLLELGDASAECAHRGVLLSLRIGSLELLSRKISFIDSVASLLEDGIEAGANYLSLETRHTADHAELRLTTDATLHGECLGAQVLGSPMSARGALREAAPSCFALRFESIAGELTRLTVTMHANAHAMARNSGAKRWSPSPSRV